MPRDPKQAAGSEEGRRGGHTRRSAERRREGGPEPHSHGDPPSVGSRAGSPRPGGWEGTGAQREHGWVPWSETTWLQFTGILYAFVTSDAALNTKASVSLSSAGPGAGGGVGGGGESPLISPLKVLCKW